MRTHWEAAFRANETDEDKVHFEPMKVKKAIESFPLNSEGNTLDVDFHSSRHTGLPYAYLGEVRTSGSRHGSNVWFYLDRTGDNQVRGCLPDHLVAWLDTFSEHDWVYGNPIYRHTARRKHKVVVGKMSRLPLPADIRTATKCA